MKEQREMSSGEEWASVLGAVTVLSLIALISLTAVGGWSWVARFLESSAPAWIQAFGSIAAIVAALIIVQSQHSLELKRRRAEERAEQLRRLRALMVVFFSAARTCEEVARKIGREHIYWPLEADLVREVRSRLMSIDPTHVPIGKLVLLIEECVLKLQLCAKLTDELSTPRPEKTQNVVRSALMGAAQECWLGMYEATRAERRLVSGREIESEESVFVDLKASRKHLDQIRKDFENGQRAAKDSELL